MGHSVRIAHKQTSISVWPVGNELNDVPFDVNSSNCFARNALIYSKENKPRTGFLLNTGSTLKLLTSLSILCIEHSLHIYILSCTFTLLLIH